MSDVVAKCDNEKITKVKVTSAEIIVSGKADKPYYEIKYYDLSKNEWCIGYGSYELKFVFQWLNECFELAKEPQECEFAHYKDLAEQGRLVDIETYQKRLIRYIDAGKYRSADKKVFSENDVIYLIEHGVFQCEAEQGKYLQKGRDDR